MKGTPRSAQICLSSPAVSSASWRDSTTQGPAMRKSGLSKPTWKPQSFISGDVLQASGHFRWHSALRFGIGHGGLDKGLEQRMAVMRRGSELGVELAAYEPRMLPPVSYTHLT